MNNLIWHPSINRALNSVIGTLMPLSAVFVKTEKDYQINKRKDEFRFNKDVLFWKIFGNVSKIIGVRDPITVFINTDGSIKVGCHKHRSPLNLKDALAQSCNTWFILNFGSMINDEFVYDSKESAVTTWRSYMQSMGLGGPMHIDIKGEEGGLLAGADYLNRRYKDGWNGKTIWWAGMGQGDVTCTPLQLCNLAVTIANRGWYYIPHIHKDTKNQRYLTKRHTKVKPEAYPPVVEGMRLAVEQGTAMGIKTSYSICGKTGTVENPGEDHSVFIAFAPQNNPKIAICVYVEHGGFGADLAAPMGGLVIEQYLKGKLSENSESRAKRIAAKVIK